MKICPGCNKVFDDQDAFCDVCGIKLENAETVVTVEPENAAPVEKKKGLLWWHILLIVLAVIIVAGIVFAIVYFTGKDNDGDADGEESVSQEEDDEDSDEKNSINGEEESIGGNNSGTEDESVLVDVPDEPEDITNNEETPDNNDNKPGSSDNNNNKPGSSDNNNNNNKPGSSDNNNNSGSGNGNSGNPGSTGTGNSSVDAQINAFFDGKYYMASYDAELGSDETLEIAVDGEDFQLSMEAEGMSLRIIYLDGATYLVNQNDKYINLNDLTDLMGEDVLETGSFTALVDKLDVSKYNFTSVTTGVEQVDNETMNYKKYTASDAQLYFYFTSEEVRRIKLVSGNDETSFDMAVNSFSPAIPSDMLDLDVLIESNVFEFALEMIQ